MPELPIYKAKNNIQPNTAEPLRNEAAQSFEAGQQITKTLQGITQQWSDANDVMQATESKAKHALGIADLKSRAALDPNFRDSDKYYKELADLKANSINGISNMQVASRIGAELSLDSEIAALEIRGNFQKKQIDYNKVMVKTNLGSLMHNKLSAPTPAMAQQYDMRINSMLSQNVQTGTLSYEEADKLLKDSQKTSVQYQIYNDPATSEKDSSVLSQLKDPKGKYGFLDPDTRLDLIQESQRRIFQNNQTYKKEVDASQNVRNDSMVEKIGNRTATFKDLDNEESIPEEQGGLPRKVLLQYRRYIENGVDKNLNEWMKEKVNGSKDLTKRAKLATEYNTLIETYLDDNSDKWTAKELLAKGLADGQLDADELKVLSPLKDNLKDIKFNKDTSPVAYAIKSVKKMLNASNASSEEIALKTKQLLGGIGEGNDPQIEAAKIMDSEMLKHFPDYKAYPKQGKRKIDRKSGRAYVIYPDGKWAWVDGGV